ncbi:Cytochrome P450 [Rasamsonia emersonii CBS 393.64]|uniref:Cytochrome P450 n=1 Tax=Rasamsonia emersonii (strain ATCC 16479 / CBS 393.64 / IMI 116815) TaxID=1408163 RepID=A0A0F4YV91_RASE3|nr:Cytochrome P450 [Rasamsonia emersonii CBS 393.64]KKA22030.1 Cytochrome P450 [Rasamsonia emersonii CBS 393.64]
MMQPIVPVLLVLVSVVILLWIKSWQSKKARMQSLGQKPPMLPYKLPFGIDAAYMFVSHMLRLDFFEWTQTLLDHPGRTIDIYVLGTRLVLTDDCDNMKAIMSSQFSDYVKGRFVHDLFESVLGDSVFTIDIRKLAKSRPIDFEVAEKYIKIFLEHLDNGGKAIEVYDLVDRLQLDIVTDIFFGHPTNSLRGEHLPFRDAMNKLLAISTARIWMGPISSLLPDSLIARKATQDFNSYLDSQVARTLSLPADELKKRQNSLTLMEALALQRPEPKYIKNQLIAVLMAGKVGIVWDMVTLSVALSETDLLVGFNIREAKRDTTLPKGGGPDGQMPVPILAGEQVIYSVIGLQRRPDIVGEDADQWRPDRYNTWTPQTWEFLPFNHGPRICLGRVFGQFQMEYTLVRIFQHFDALESADGREQRIKIEMNTKMAYPVMCRFHRARSE